jgi:DNA-binding CsgD family transcriptional regulator
MLDDSQWCSLGKRYELTVRERQVARLVCQGLRTVAIAEHLRIRPGTVKTHVRNIYRKIRVRNRVSLLLRLMAEPGASSADQPDT